MKLSVTNFYNVRFLTANQIPLSTAIWDPKWFHDFKGPDHIFKDKNGVWNGLRCEAFVPGLMCEGLCHGSPCTEQPSSCMFLKHYAQQLNLIDFDNLMAEWTKLAEQIKTHEGIEGEMEIVLLVYEKIDNSCSERWPIIEFFRSNNAEIRSF